jgi:hypothetical protein
MPRRRNQDYTDEVDRLLTEAEQLPHGPTRIELCEESVRIADSHNDFELAYRAREELVEAACFGGRPDLLIVAFSWCLATFDRDPDGPISLYSLLWRMKWVVSALPKFPEIELATIHGMLDDMERRFRDFGGSTQPVVGKRRSVALQTGDLDAARAIHKQFMRMSRSFLSDCHACELDALASYWMDMRNNTLGVRKAEEVINGGMRCAEVPQVTFAEILLPIVRIGRAADAMKYHKKGYPLVRRNVGEVAHWGEHICYLALTGNEARAAKLFEKHLPDVENSHDPLEKLAFLRHMLVVVECLADQREKMKLRLPKESPFANDCGEYVLADVGQAIRRRVGELSRQFDRRNRNSYYTELVEELPELLKKRTRVAYVG